MNKTEPIRNEFKEHLEDVQSFSRTCNIRFKVENEGVLSVDTKITNLHLEPIEQAYLKTETGLFIAFDKLISVDGMMSGTAV